MQFEAEIEDLLAQQSAEANLEAWQALRRDFGQPKEAALNDLLRYQIAHFWNWQDVEQQLDIGALKLHFHYEVDDEGGYAVSYFLLNVTLTATSPEWPEPLRNVHFVGTFETRPNADRSFKLWPVIEAALDPHLDQILSVLD